MPMANFADAERSAQDPGAQQAFAHRGDGGIEHTKERDLRSGIGKQWLNQLEIAHCYGVEYQTILTVVEPDAVYVM